MTSKMTQVSALIAVLLISNSIFVYLYLKRPDAPPEALSIQLDSSGSPLPSTQVKATTDTIPSSPANSVAQRRVTQSVPAAVPVQKSTVHARKQPAQARLQAPLPRLRSIIPQPKGVLVPKGKASKDMESLKLGRNVIQDFEKKFFQYSNFFNEGNFLAFFQSQSNNYLLNHQIRVYRWQTEQSDFKQFHQEVIQWILSLEPNEIQSTARFVAFSLNEPFFQIPLSSLASELIPELTSIDFSTPLLLDNQEIPPERNSDGELTHTRPVFLQKYSSAQQFFYRRGSLVTENVILFLKAYLFHANS